MKKCLFILFFLPFLISSCQSTMRGSGNVITDPRDVGSFHKVKSDIMSEVILVQDSSKSSVDVSGYENLVQMVETHVDDGELVISMKSHFIISNNNTKITVHVPQLDEIDFGGVGNLKTESSFRFNHLRVRLTGVGSITLAGEAGYLNLESSGVGSISTKEVACDTVYARTTGVGSISCNAIKYLNAEVTGVGSISYTGDPQVDKKVSGVGSVKKSD